jgi:hypothetical protein
MEQHLSPDAAQLNPFEAAAPVPQPFQLNPTKGQNILGGTLVTPLAVFRPNAAAICR